MDAIKVKVNTEAAREDDLRYMTWVRDDTLFILGPSMPKKIVFHDASVEPTIDIEITSAEDAR